MGMREQPRWESGNPGNWVSISRGDEGIGTERLAVDRLNKLEARAQYADALAEAVSVCYSGICGRCDEGWPREDLDDIGWASEHCITQPGERPFWDTCKLNRYEAAIMTALAAYESTKKDEPVS